MCGFNHLTYKVYDKVDLWNILFCGMVSNKRYPPPSAHRLYDVYKSTSTDAKGKASCLSLSGSFLTLAKVLTLPRKTIAG